MAGEYNKGASLLEYEGGDSVLQVLPSHLSDGGSLIILTSVDILTVCATTGCVPPEE